MLKYGLVLLMRETRYRMIVFSRIYKLRYPWTVRKHDRISPADEQFMNFQLHEHSIYSEFHELVRDSSGSFHHEHQRASWRLLGNASSNLPLMYLMTFLIR